MRNTNKQAKTHKEQTKQKPHTHKENPTGRTKLFYYTYN